MAKKVLITDHAHELLQQGLEQAGFECDYIPEISYERCLELIPQYEGLVINSKILVNRPFLDRAEKLQFVARLGSGLEIIDLAYAKARQVQVFSSPEGNCDAVAEHALAMLLATAIKLKKSDAEMQQLVWDREGCRGWELGGKTLAIIGFGHTGSAFARKLRGLDMQILAYDKYKTDYTAAYPYVQQSDMGQIFAQADIVSLHLPLTAETRYMVDEAWLGRFSKNIVFINTARGQLLSSQTLLKGLQAGKIRAACVDVWENEKPATYTEQEKQDYQQISQLPNVLSSPHVAGWTLESKYKLAHILLNKILAVFSPNSL